VWVLDELANYLVREKKDRALRRWARYRWPLCANDTPSAAPDVTTTPERSMTAPATKFIVSQSVMRKGKSKSDARVEQARAGPAVVEDSTRARRGAAEPASSAREGGSPDKEHWLHVALYCRFDNVVLPGYL